MDIEIRVSEYGGATESGKKDNRFPGEVPDDPKGNFSSDVHICSWKNTKNQRLVYFIRFDIFSGF
jgi:hypothetical protein